MKAGKVWGETSLVHANGVLEFHRIEVDAGGECSKHKHQFKWNGFFVESGCLEILVWQNDYDLVDKTILYGGDFMQVKPGVFHSFEAKENTIAFELYWAEFDHNDIIRESVGKLNDPMDELVDSIIGPPLDGKVTNGQKLNVCGHPGCTNWTNLKRFSNGMVRCDFHYDEAREQGGEEV